MSKSKKVMGLKVMFDTESKNVPLAFIKADNNEDYIGIKISDLSPLMSKHGNCLEDVEVNEEG